jgi:single-strand DNA-binding protein
MNSIVLVGRLTRDPELRYVASSDPVVNFAIAVERGYRNADGEREVDFSDIVAWRKLAENTAKYTGKGHLVGVRGRLQIRSYQTQDGQKRKVAEVVADTVRFLGAPRNGEQDGRPCTSPSRGPWSLQRAKRTTRGPSGLAPMMSTSSTLG